MQYACTQLEFCNSFSSLSFIDSEETCPKKIQTTFIPNDERTFAR